MKDLQIKSVESALEQYPKLVNMVKDINARMPEIHSSTMNFCKKQSQFMDNMLTLNHPTTFRNIRQILAEIERTMGGLRQAFFSNERKKIERAKLVTKLKVPTNKDLVQLDILEIDSDITESEKYQSGGVRKITNYLAQLDSLKSALIESHGVDSWSEIDFEKEEEKYHVMTAFSQALTAARSRGGLIDEGNHIYLFQIGINGASAQYDIAQYLGLEGKEIAEGRLPAHAMTLHFLEEMALKYARCSTVYADRKNLNLTTKEALLQ